MPENLPNPLRPRMIVGIDGVSGIGYGLRLIEALRRLDVETHVVMADVHEHSAGLETPLSVSNVRAAADYWYTDVDAGVTLTSDSLHLLGMIVAPCSAHSLSAIASGNASGLLARAADICLKNRRRVVLLFGEAPLHSDHIRSMAAATDHGAIVFPPVADIDDRSQSCDTLMDRTIGRILDLFELDATHASPRSNGVALIPADWNTQPDPEESAA